jgi:F-type H+-transporting ATPase subunit b
MDEILQQLGTLLLGAVPTAILFLFLLVSYRFLVHGPLLRTLAERRFRTQGAIERAQAAIAAADAKAQEYETRLREARAEIFKARERRMQQWNAEKDTALESFRQQAQDRVRQARAVIDAEAVEARRKIESSADDLADQILKAILPQELAVAESSR